MLKKLFAAVLPQQKPPKLPGKEVVVQKYLGKSRGTAVTNTASNITNINLPTDARGLGSLNEVIKRLVLVSPDLAAALATKISTTITGSYTVIAYDELGRPDQKATETIQAFTRSLDFSTYDSSRFTHSTDFRTVSSMLLMDNLRYGAMGLELVLGQGRVPAHIKPIPVRLLSWADNTPDSYPVYAGPDGGVPLNYPTIFYSCTQQDLESPYPDNPMQAAIQISLWDMEFVNSLRSAATKNLLARLKVAINSEKYLQTLPTTVQVDPDLLAQHMDATVAKLEAQLNGLEPEDSLVIFDMLDVTTIADKNRSEDRSIEVLQNLINGKIATGAKILPSVIGRGTSSSAASAEAMLFVKSLSSVQTELNTILSRALTLAARIFGHPVTVSFKYQEVNLRPELELASFKAVEQSTTLELLSLGFITDLEASIKLTGTIPPAGFKPLSGTGFKSASPNDGQTNSYSNTSVSNDGKPDSNQTEKNNAPEEKGVKSK